MVEMIKCWTRVCDQLHETVAWRMLCLCGLALVAAATACSGVGVLGERGCVSHYGDLERADVEEIVARLAESGLGNVDRVVASTALGRGIAFGPSHEIGDRLIMRCMATLTLDGSDWRVSSVAEMQFVRAVGESGVVDLLLGGASPVNAEVAESLIACIESVGAFDGACSYFSASGYPDAPWVLPAAAFRDVFAVGMGWVSAPSTVAKETLVFGQEHVGDGHHRVDLAILNVARQRTCDRWVHVLCIESQGVQWVGLVGESR